MADKKISALPAATTPLAGTEVLPIVQSGTTDQVSVANLTAGRDVSAKTLTGESNGVGSPSEVIARNTAGAERIHLLSRSEPGVSYLQVQNAQAIVGTLDNFALQIRTNNAQRMSFDTSGNASVTNGNLVVGTAGKGIDFSANANAPGMTSELLNWYEEGTWTGALTCGTSGTITLNASFQTGSYTRIGRLVTVTGLFLVDSVSSPVGILYLTGLPYAINNGGNFARTAASVCAFDLAATANTSIVGRGLGGESQIQIFKYAAGALSNLAGDVVAGSQFYVSMTYITV